MIFANKIVSPSRAGPHHTSHSLTRSLCHQNQIIKARTACACKLWMKSQLRYAALFTLVTTTYLPACLPCSPSNFKIEVPTHSTHYSGRPLSVSLLLCEIKENYLEFKVNYGFISFHGKKVSSSQATSTNSLSRLSELSYRDNIKPKPL